MASSSSFPFLAIARECGASYGTVIRCAEAIQRNTPRVFLDLDDIGRLSAETKVRIAEALDAEAQRRRDVVEGLANG